MSSQSEIAALSSIIASSVKDLEAAYAKQGIPYPSIDDTFVPSPLDRDPSLTQARCNLVAAATQIIASVRSPLEVLFGLGAAFHSSTAIGVAIDNHFADILKEAGPQGLHAKEIAAIAGIDQSKTSRILRFLATNHVFKEITPNVFANNRASSLLVKPKPVSALKADPISAYDGAPLAAMVSHTTEQVMRCAPFVGQFIRENRQDIASPFNLAHNTTESAWEWYEKSENELIRRRFAVAMSAGDSVFDPTVLIKSKYWGHLTEDDVVVDVGGSAGSVVLRLAKEYPKPRFVVQDLQKVIEGAAKAYWQKENPEAISSGRVQLQTHDFFSPNPIKNAAVYFLRAVLHDWSDEECVKILAHIRTAASPKSKLILFESMMPPACPDSGEFSANQVEAPYPLLANFGAGKGLFHVTVDLQMMTGTSGQERTVEEFVRLGKASGWKLESVDITTAIPARMSGLLFSAA